MLDRAQKLTMVWKILLLVIMAVMQTASGQNKQTNSAAWSGDKILITNGGQLSLIDRETKKVLWQTTELRGAAEVALFPNGEILVGERKSIARVSSEGKLISRNPITFDQISDVKALDNERMLISDGPAHTVVEMDWAGNVFWSVKGLHYPSEAVRLGGGNTLIADGTAAVKEFDTGGVLLRQMWVKQWASSVERLSDGNTLVGGSLFVQLLDSAGRPTWSRESTSRVTCIRRLSEDEVFVCEPDARRIAIINRKGETIWEVTGLSYPWHALYLK
jgi:outer membrane protein assembly factor BamB